MKGDHINTQTIPDKKEVLLTRSNVLVVILFLIATSAIGFSALNTMNINRNFYPMLEIIDDVDLNISRFHVGLEEHIAGDRTVDITSILERSHRANYLVKTLLNGGEYKGKFIAIELPEPVRNELALIVKNIEILDEVAQVRVEFTQLHKAGSDLDIEFDATIKFIETALVRIQTHNQSVIRSNAVYTLILDTISLLVLVSLGIGNAVLVIAGRRDNKKQALISIELLQARQSQKEIAEDLTTLIDTANAPIFGIDANGRVNEWNQTVERITGFTKDVVMGQDLVATYITDDYKAAVKEVLDKALAGEQTANYEFPLFTDAGDRVDVLLNATTRRGPSGAVTGVIGIGQDITELSKVRVAQAQIAEDLTTLIDTANAPIFGIDANGRVNEWNQTAERITGFTKDVVMGQDLVATYITDDYKAAVKEVLDKALAGEQTANYEFPLFTESGNRVMILLNATTRRGPSGEVTGVIGIGQDITELDQYRTSIEKSYDERSRELNEVFKLSPDGFVFFDSNNQIVISNPAFWTMTALEEKDLLGLSEEEFIQIMGKLMAKESFAVFNQFLEQPGRNTILNLDEPSFKVLGFTTRLLVDNQKLTRGKILYFKDITSEAEVDRMKSEFLSTAAHELRTPLASILGFSELLLMRSYTKEQENEMVNTIYSQSTALKRLLDDLLDLARIEARAAKVVNKVTADLGSIVENSIRTIEGINPNWHVAFHKIGSDFTLKCDIEMLQRAVVNVINNAFKYSPVYPKVVVSLEEKEDSSGYMISTTDNGIGMSEDQVNNLGTRFWRADDSGSIPGTGLGVALVMEILDLHDGYMVAESSLGNGTTVTIHLNRVAK